MGRVLLLLLLAVYSFRRGENEVCDPQSRLLQQFPAFYTQLSPDGSKLAGIKSEAGYNFAAVWEVESGELLGQFLVPNMNATSTVVWSPDGSRFIVPSNPTLVLTATLSLLLNLSMIANWGAWSPAGDMFVVTNSSTCWILNSTSGEVTAQWKCTCMSQISWSPGPFIVHDVHAWDPNGRLAFLLPLNIYSSSDWITNTTLAVHNQTHLFEFNASGSMVRVHRFPASYRIIWSRGGDFLSLCDPRCSIWDRASLSVVLEIAIGGSVVSLSSERALLVTTRYGLTTMWSTQTSLVRSFPTPFGLSNWYWNDDDNLLVFGAMGTSAIYNVRTLDTKPSTLSQEVKTSCMMRSELFMGYKNGTIQVSKDGNVIRQWETNNINFMFCAYDDVISVGVCNGWCDSNFVNDLLIYHKRGLLLGKLSVNEQVFGVALVTKDILAYTSPNCIHLYPNTSSARQIKSDFPYFQLLSWSPDGSLLAVLDPASWTIYNAQGDNIMHGTKGGSRRPEWTSNNVVLMSLNDGSYLAVYPLRRSVVYWTTELCRSDGGIWNPSTVELMCLDSGNFVLLKPLLPEVYEVSASGNTVGANATFSLKAETYFFPFPLRAMVRWIDTSTSKPQCLYLNVDSMNETSVTLETVVLPQPGMYTLYLSGLPWVGSEGFSVHVHCLDPALPLNANGRLTSCTCPAYMYTTNSDRQGPIECSPCPSHGVCNGTSHVASKQGFWSITDTHFIACAAGACTGNNKCEELYYGLLCGLCIPGAGQHGFGRCQRCKAGVDTAFVISGLLFWIMCCVLQSLFALGWSWRNRSHTGNNNNNNSAQLSAILVSTAQANALLLSLNVDLTVIYDVLGYVEEYSQNGLPSAAVSCLLLNAGFKPGRIHYTKQIIILMLPILAWVVLHSLRGILKLCGVTTSNDLVRVPTVVVWSSLQAFFYTSVLQTLNCKKVDPSENVYRLQHDLSVICYDKTYWLMLGLVTIPAILAIVIVPLRIYWLLRFHPTASSSGHLQFLVKSYRTNWWFLVITARKMVLAILVTSTRNPFYIACCLAFACGVHVVVSPSTSRIVNIAESISLLSSTFIFAVAGSLSLYDFDSFQTYQNGAYVLLSAAGISYSLQCMLLIYDRRWSSRQVKAHTDGPHGYQPIDSVY